MSSGSAHYQILIFIENHHIVEKRNIAQINIYEGLFPYKWRKALLFCHVVFVKLSTSAF